MSDNKANNINTSKPMRQIDLIELFWALIRKWYLLLLCAVIGFGFLGFTQSRMPDQYISQSTVFVLSKNATVTTMSDLQIGSVLSGDFAYIAKSKPVVDTAIQTVYENTGVKLTRRQASEAIGVNVLRDTRIIKYTITYTDPEIACELCNALTEALSDQIAIVMQSDKPSVIEYAEVNNNPLDKGVMRQAVKGGAIGFFLCASVLAFLFLIDDKVKTPEDVEKYLGETVLVCIPMDKAQVFESKKHKSSK